MNGIDLKVTPVERSIGVGVINLTLTGWILGALYCQRGVASRTELFGMYIAGNY